MATTMTMKVESSSNVSRFVQLGRFVRLLTVEPYMLLFLASFFVQDFPKDQLLQDKLCVQKYGQSVEYCRKLPKMSAEDDITGKKSSILVDVTQLNMYLNIELTIPTAIICLFIGQFIDQYRGAKKILFVISAALISFETFLHFLNSYFFSLDYRYYMVTKLLQALIGNPNTQFTAVWSYVAAVTPNHLRAVRMTCIMVCIYASDPITSMLGGMTLGNDPLFAGHEFRNYSTVYLISLALSLLALVCALTLVDEERDRELYRRYFPSENLDVDQLKDDINNNNSNVNDDLEQQDSINDEVNTNIKQPPPQQLSPWKILFNLDNIRPMFKTIVKPRPYLIRMQTYMSISAIALYLFSLLGFPIFGYQYTERVLNWDTKQFGIYTTITDTTNIVTSVLMSSIIARVFNVADLTMSLIGLTMVTLANLTRSISTQLWAFELSIVFYSFNLLTTVGFRSYISKIIPPNEIGSVFSFVSIFEAVAPMASSIVLALVFGATIDTVPTLSFTVMTISTTIGLLFGFYISYMSKITLRKLQSN